jgi:predicted ABC-type ATPase
LVKRDFVGFTIILDHQGMVHRNICRPLLKVRHRIAAGRHHIAQKLVGFRYRTPGTVNEPPLDAAPRLCKPRPIALG